MKTKILDKTWKTLAVFCGAGTLFASSCDPSTVRAIVVGVDSIVSEIDDDDVSFRDWFNDELDHIF